MNTKEDKISLIKKLSNDFSSIISRNEISLHKSIDWGKNGIGNRFCNGYFNYICIYKHKYKVYSDIEIDVDTTCIHEFQKENFGIGIIGIKIVSVKTNDINRPIRKSIKIEICKKSCVVCGSNTDITCDHKNDFYNDPRVLCLKTQVIDDFQPLCNHCNLQKRQVCKKEKESNIIYSAKNIPQLAMLNIEFPWEKSNSKSESYWYDPIEFFRKTKIYIQFIPCIKEINLKKQSKT